MINDSCTRRDRAGSRRASLGLLLLGLWLLLGAVALQAQTPLSEADSSGVIQPGSTSQSEIKAARENAIAEWQLFKASKMISALFVFVVGWVLLRYTGIVLNVLSERWPRYRLTIKGFIPVIRILGWSGLISFVVVGIFKPPIQSVLAFTASAGIAIGFASQDILKNIFGGVVILFDKPFGVGDKIQIDTHYGEVLSIGLRTVRLVTADDSVVAVPNSEIVSKSVSNANSGAPDCQVVVSFFLPVGCELDRAQELALRCAALSRYAYLNKARAVVFSNQERMGRGLIQMKLKVYVLDHRFEFALVSDLTRIVIREFRREGLPILDGLSEAA